MNLQYVKCIIDTNIVNEHFGSRIITNLTNLGVRYELRGQTLANVIMWQRSIQQTFMADNNLVSTYQHY